MNITPAAIRALAEQAGVHTSGALDREKVEALVDEGDIYLAEFEATDSWGSGGLVPAREYAVTRFLDALEACVVPDPRIARIEALIEEPWVGSTPDGRAVRMGMRAILRGDQ